MNGEKDSPPIDFSIESRPLTPGDMSRLLRAMAQVTRELQPFVTSRQAWEAQGLTKVPAAERKSRRDCFRALARCAPSILSDLPRLSTQSVEHRIALCDALATTFERRGLDVDKCVENESAALIRRTLTIAAWKQTLSTRNLSGRKAHVEALVARWEAELGL